MGGRWRVELVSGGGAGCLSHTYMLLHKPTAPLALSWRRHAGTRGSLGSQTRCSIVEYFGQF